MSGEGESLPVTQGLEYRVKLGKSFTFPERNAFHSLKYDFKPQSVDSRRPGRLKMTEDGAVNVSLPVGQEESGEDCAQFRGPKKMCTKECILIIDRNTGEAILERISDTVQLKAIRDGRKLTMARDRSVSPSCPPNSQPKTIPSKPMTKTPSTLAPPTISKTPHSAKKSKSQSNQGGLPSKGLSAGKADAKSKGKSQTQRTSHHLATSLTAGSASSKQHKSLLSEIGLDSHLMQEISPLRSTNPTPEPPTLKKAKVFEESSSSSASSSSSSGSSSSDGEGIDEKPPFQALPSSNSSASSVLHGGKSSSHIPLARSIPSTAHSIPSTAHSDSHTNKTGPTAKTDSSRPHHAPASASTLRLSQRSDATPTSRTSSGGRPMASQNVAPSMPSLAHFLDQSSYQLLHKQENPQQKQHKQQQQKQAPPPPRLQPPHSTHSHMGTYHPPQNLPPPPPRQKIAEMSSSSSDSDSSSGSSTSGSSSSDEENDREVANVFSKPQLPSRQMSMSVLRNDLNLSESGSDSD